MNKQELLAIAKIEYERVLVHIERMIEFVEPIEALMPDGWEITFNSHAIYPLLIKKGNMNSNKVSIDEFQAVCKFFEIATKSKLRKEINAVFGTQEIRSIESSHSYYRDDFDLSFKIILYNPDRKCNVTWKEKRYLEAVIDDDCLRPSQ